MMMAGGIHGALLLLLLLRFQGESIGFSLRPTIREVQEVVSWE